MPIGRGRGFHPVTFTSPHISRVKDGCRRVTETAARSASSTHQPEPLRLISAMTWAGIRSCETIAANLFPRRRERRLLAAAALQIASLLRSSASLRP